LGDLGIDERVILKCIIYEEDVVAGRFHLAEDRVLECNEYLLSIRGGEFS
jgi:hypothetical protein